jgi:fluoroacetyl-CoA thioesterase
MKARPHPGLSNELSIVVETKHAIDFAEGGMPAVLSTPNLIGLLERTARLTLAPFLEANERTVGIEIELRHLAPTPVGETVTCTARVIHVDAREISFHLEARDAHEIIARGSHRRAVIRVESFNRRVQAKARYFAP